MSQLVIRSTARAIVIIRWLSTATPQDSSWIGFPLNIQ